MKLKNSLKLSMAIVAGAIIAVAVPLSASAHVTITPNIAEAGSFVLLTFKVPNESATAVTTTFEVDLPTDTPFTSVSYVPVAGWTTNVITSTLPKPVTVGENQIKEAVTKVIWTAQPGAEIKAGQLQLFPLSVGAVPDTGKVTLKASQTYSDGTIAKWTDTSPNAQEPAPILYINDTPPAAEAPGAGGPTVTSQAATNPGSTTASADDVTARGLGVGGLVLGAIGIVLAVVALRRRPTE
ncbi:MAG: hypothetical protein QOG18_2000 [Microbacteriaceae bacterium]|nr:hypothetical protein [Microbacteriaceae bacterium]MDQ1578891.1 hypothetical protein [Microbacteriaceae bacterium]